jgi:hypothetical protein
MDCVSGPWAKASVRSDQWGGEDSNKESRRRVTRAEVVINFLAGMDYLP